MILRIRVDGRVMTFDEVLEDWRVVQVRQMGPGAAGFRGECWRGLPSPELTNKRARFYFTERGWHEVGQHVLAEAKLRGHVVSVVRRPDPTPSQVVYRDAWQVAILPGKRGSRRRSRPR